MADVVFATNTFLMANDADGVPSGHTEEVKLGGAVNPSEVVYLETDGRYKRGDAVTGVKAIIRGVALSGGATDQPALIATNGDFNVVVTSGGPLVAGDILVVSPSADSGKVGRLADVLSTRFLSLAFLVLNPTKIRLIHNIDNVVQIP